MSMFDEWTSFPTPIQVGEEHSRSDGNDKNPSKKGNNIQGIKKSKNAQSQSVLYFSSVTTAVYVMQSTADPTIFRSGAFGYRKTNALIRLKSVNGTRKWNTNPTKYAPFKYIFLAPLPDDLGHKLEEAETGYLHADITTHLGVGNPGKNPFQLLIPNAEKTIQNVATDAVARFLIKRYTGSSSNVDNALHGFFSITPAFHKNPSKYNTIQEFLNSENMRAISIAEMNSGFSMTLIKQLLLLLATRKLKF